MSILAGIWWPYPCPPYRLAETAETKAKIIAKIFIFNRSCFLKVRKSTKFKRRKILRIIELVEVNSCSVDLQLNIRLYLYSNFLDSKQFKWLNLELFERAHI